MDTAKEYLGDSVYAAFDGLGIVLTTENGMGPINRIVLEPEVLTALNRYVERVKTIWHHEITLKRIGIGDSQELVAAIKGAGNTSWDDNDGCCDGARSDYFCGE